MMDLKITEQLLNHSQVQFHLTKFLHSTDKDMLYNSCTDQCVRGRGSGSLLRVKEVHVDLYLHPPFPSITTHWQCKLSHPRQTSISPRLLCATLQHLSSMSRLCLWHCPLLYCAAIRRGWDRRGERQAVKQFPPSESHSNPHTGEWGLTPARQWHKHWQTKDLSSEQVRML